MKTKQSYQLFFLLLFLVSPKLKAQELVHPREVYKESAVETRAFDEGQWNQTIEGINYSKSYREDLDYDEDFSDEPGGKKKKKKQAENASGSSPFWNFFVKILFIVLGLLLIAFIIYSIAKGELFRPRSTQFSTDQTNISLETIEDNIHESDLDRFIKEALQNENYALAIRLYYLAIIKELSINRNIKWKRDKTNRDYLRELKGSSLFSEFRDATRIFERIWYGDGELLKNDFQQLRPRFQQWINNARQVQKQSST